MDNVLRFWILFTVATLIAAKNIVQHEPQPQPDLDPAKVSTLAVRDRIGRGRPQSKERLSVKEQPNDMMKMFEVRSCHHD